MDPWRSPIVGRKLLPLTISLIVGLTAAHLAVGSSGWAATPASSQAAQGGNVTVEKVRYQSGGASIEAHLAKPTGDGKRPAILVVHDVGGVNATIQDAARRLAEAGFVALAPDLMAGSGIMSTPQMELPLSDEETPDVRIGGPLRATVEAVKAGIAYLRGHAEVDSSKISAMGFGWGGWRAFKLAEEIPTLYRAVIFYGATPTEVTDNDLDGIRAPVLGHYAQYDFRTTGNVLWTAKTLKAKGKSFTYYVYPRAQRGFMNIGAREYHEEASKEAWTRTAEFLR